MSGRANPTRFVVSVALLVSPALLGAQRGAPRSASRVDGVVHDTAGLRISEATVAAVQDGRPLAITDDSGAFHVDGLAPGRIALLVRRLGFRPDTLEIVVQDSRPMHIDIVMIATAVVLAGESIQADSARSF